MRYSHLLILSLLWPLGVQAKQFYVDNILGDNTQPGSVHAPWKTIQHGIAQIASGDVLVVHGNGLQHPYRERVVHDLPRSTKGTIIITGADASSPPALVGTHDWTDESAGGGKRWHRLPNERVSARVGFAPASVWMSSTSQWSVNGIESLQSRARSTFIRPLPGEWMYDRTSGTIEYALKANESLEQLHIEIADTRSLLRVNNQNRVEYHNLDFYYSGKTSVAIAGSSSIKLSRVRIYHAGQNAISVSEGDNVAIEGCDIRYAHNNGIVFGGSRARPLSDSRISGCTISHVEQNDCITLHKNSALDDIGSHFLVAHNVLSHCAEQGIDVTSGTHVKLLDNKTEENGVSGIVVGHDVSEVDIVRHNSRDEGRTANIIIGRSSDVLLADSYIVGWLGHQLVIKDARNVTVRNTRIRQSAQARTSVVDIAGAVNTIRFENNDIIAASKESGSLLRYLQGTNPEKANATFVNNTWCFPRQNVRQVYTDQLNRHSFWKHASYYAGKLRRYLPNLNSRLGSLSKMRLIATADVLCGTPRAPFLR